MPHFLPCRNSKHLQTTNLMLHNWYIYSGNIVGKGENAGHQHFLLLLEYFLQPFFVLWVVKTMRGLYSKNKI